MAKSNYKSKQKLKNVGTATALTITLATSNLPTLAYAMESESNTSDEIVKQQPTTEENISTPKEIQVAPQEEAKEEVPSQETQVDTKDEVVPKEVTTQNLSQQSNISNFDLNGWNYNEEADTIILKQYKGTQTNIVIPGKIEKDGKLFNVKIAPEVRKNAHNEIETSLLFAEDIKSNITSVKFEEIDGQKVEVADIPIKCLFDACESLESVDLSGLNTSTVNDMSFMFRNCKNLTSIVFGNEFNTEHVTNMTQMFRYCESLTNLDLSQFNTSNVKNMSYMFDGCTNLTNVDLSNFNTAKLTATNDMFRNCKELTDLDLSNLNTSNVKNMSYMFDGCTNLQNLKLSKSTTQNLTDIKFMFRNCKSLEDLDLSNLNLSGIETLNNVFTNSGLKTLNLSNVDISGLKSLSNLFGQEVTSLEEVNLSGAKISQNDTSMSEMFKGCTNLTTVNLSNIDFSKVINVSNMFDGCNHLIDVNLSGENLSGITTLSGMFKNSSVKKINLSGAILTGLTHFSNLFGEATSLQEVNLSGAKISQNVTSMAEMFKGSANLIKVDLSDMDLSHITTIANIFDGCTNLQNVNLSKSNLSALNNISGVFTKLENLTTVNLSETNMAGLKTFEKAFENCKSLQEVNLSGADLSNASALTGAFGNCNSLTTINLNNLNINSVTTMYRMFENCTSLSSIDLSNLDTPKVTDLTSLFLGCSSLTDVKLGGNFDTSKVTKFNNMFKDCTSLKEIDTKSINTNSATNMSYMFSDTGVKTLDLSNFNTQNVTNMSGMFRNTESLESIDFGDNFNTSKVTNMSYMFCNSNVKSLNLDEFDTSSLENTKAMFALLNNITILDLSNFNLDKVTDMQSMFGKNLLLDDAYYKKGTITIDPDATPKELLVIAKDAKLLDHNYYTEADKDKAYDYEADACLPVDGPIVDANGGKFADNTDRKSLFKENVINPDTIDSVIQNKLASVDKPTRQGYTFISWEANKKREINPSIFDKLSTVYYANWDKAPEITIDNKEVTIKAGQAFDAMAGVDVSDQEDTTLSINDITLSGDTVDENTKPGVYTIIYTLKDSAGNIVTASRKVTVLSNNAPIVIGGGNKTLKPSQLDTFNPIEDLRVTDDHDSFNDIKVSITITDKNTGNVVDKMSTPQVDTENVYDLSIVFTDTDNNSTKIERTITVTNYAPTINGLSDITIKKGQTVDLMANVSAKDKEDGTIANSEIKVQNIDLSKLDEGQYTVEYTVTDSDNNTTTVQRKVTITSNKPVQITGPLDVTLKPSDLEEFNKNLTAGLTVEDDYGTDNLQVETTITNGSGQEVSELTKPQVGTEEVYKIVMNVTDIDGNVTKIERTITVTNDAPTINGLSDITIKEGQTLDLMANVSAEDKEDGPISNSEIKVQDIDLSKLEAGEYTVEYTVTDSDNNTTTVLRKVTIEKLVTSDDSTNNSSNSGDESDKQEVNKEEQNNQSNGSENPKTGDNIFNWAITGMTSLLALPFVNRKRRK